MKYIYPQPIARVTHIPTPAPLVELGLKRLLPPSLIHTTPLRVPEKSSWLLCLFENKNQEKQNPYTLYCCCFCLFVFTLLLYNSSQKSHKFLMSSECCH